MEPEQKELKAGIGVVLDGSVPTSLVIGVGNIEAVGFNVDLTLLYTTAKA